MKTVHVQASSQTDRTKMSDADEYRLTEHAGPNNGHPLLVLLVMWLFIFTAVLAALWVWF
jgi:hypothetical protein